MTVPAWALVAVVAIVLVLLSSPSPSSTRTTLAATRQAESPSTVTQDLEAPDGGALERFAEIAEVATGAVVRIESRVPASEAPAPAIPDLLEPFFGPGMPSPDAMPRTAGGSGVIVSDDGRILTNAHVVQGGDRLTVWLDDRRSFDAALVGLDPTTDIAVLDIDATDLPTLPLGDSDDIRVGEWVLAIGSPGVGGGQLDQTVTSGIVSALGRPLRLVRRDLLEDPSTREFAGYAIENFIQTDAVINPGNSGGPLLDMNGRVIGINTAIASATGFYLGYGFAVPANLARGVMDDLVEFGEVRRAQLGINVTTVTPEDVEFFGLDEVQGVLVQSASPGGPADAAGIRQGDVILSIDGQPVEGVGALQQEVAERTPGDEVRVTFVRDGEEIEATVRLGETEFPTHEATEPDSEAEVAERLGLTLGALSPERRSELGYGSDARGAVVLDVAPLSPADRKGIQPGVLVTEVAGEPVTSPDAAVAALSGLEPGSVTALLIGTPDGNERIVTLRVPS